jgi:hypothetical protein
MGPLLQGNSHSNHLHVSALQVAFQCPLITLDHTNIVGVERLELTAMEMLANACCLDGTLLFGVYVKRFAAFAHFGDSDRNRTRVFRDQKYGNA